MLFQMHLNVNVDCASQMVLETDVVTITGPKLVESWNNFETMKSFYYVLVGKNVVHRRQ